MRSLLCAAIFIGLHFIITQQCCWVNTRSSFQIYLKIWINSLSLHIIIKNAYNFMESPLVYYMSCIHKHPTFLHTEVDLSYGYAQTHHQSSDIWVIDLIEGLQPKACTQLELWMLFCVACFNHPLRSQTVEWEPLCPSPSPSLFVVQYLMPLLSDIVCSSALMEKEMRCTCAWN